ncbi:hypothetical protein BX600DRAFT_499472 [Xylariales sp. PMI_506]|nr:hypothetical protein BX600DRAFT_499472 [Xylariales sp. PMI_506]
MYASGTIKPGAQPEAQPLTADMDDGRINASRVTNGSQRDDTAPARGQAAAPGLQAPYGKGVPPDRTLHYRKTPIWLLALYLPTLIVPWILTCVTSYWNLRSNRPFAVGGVVAILFIELLDSINSVLVVPIISTLLAHAAVVYTMRRAADQKLTLLQLFTLADKKWTDIPTLWSAKTTGKSSGFLWLAALLLLFSAVLGPIKSVVVQFEQVPSISREDLPLIGENVYTVGFDPEPADMPLVPHDLIVQDVLSHLVTVSDDADPQRYMWPVNPDAGHWVDAWITPSYRREFFSYSNDFGENPEGFFVTALENNTVTGVLREHAIRLNSSVTCEHIDETAYPSPCPGDRPLDMSIAREGVQLSVCAPGNMTKFPFTTSRNRQDISEELYIDLHVPELTKELLGIENFTMHCTASTTRGYFELGNVVNNYVYGPLIDTWPDNNTLENEFNDYRGVGADWAQPTADDPSAWSNDMLPFQRSIGTPFNWEYNAESSGPLMTSAEALFGNYSFLHPLADNSTNMTAAQALVSVCERGTIPFSQLLYIIQIGTGPVGYCSGTAGFVELASSPDSLDANLDRVVASFVTNFNSTDYAEYMLMVSMYFANSAILSKTVSLTTPLYSREIYASGGTIIYRPKFLNLASMIVVTILVAIQLVGLSYLAWFIYSVPTWTSTLDAAAMTRIGHAIKDDGFPALGAFTAREEDKLRKFPGLIGIVEADVEKQLGNDGSLYNSSNGDGSVHKNQPNIGTTSVPLSHGGDSSRSPITLGLGATGLVTKRPVSK